MDIFLIYNALLQNIAEKNKRRPRYIDILCSWISRHMPKLKIDKMPVLLKLIYRFKASPNKSQRICFVSC